MSYSLESLSSKIFVNEFDSDTGLTTQVRISGWLESNVGQLNSKIYTSFDDDLSTPSGASYVFGHEEAAIFSQMYVRDYYSKAARKTLLGQSVSANSSSTSITGMSDWTKIQEGDTVIERQPLYTTSTSSGGLDITKISQRYYDLMESAAINISELVASYNIQSSSPSQVFGSDGE